MPHPFRVPSPASIAVVLALAGAASTSFADCVDGVRKATASEQSFAARAAPALAAAIPAPTANAVRRGAPFDFKSTVQAGSLCGGAP
ncbi:MAG: hypothetical protein O9345_01700 [Burkholderiaceae bacterium]|jgi:hypothetical protein|nr:hypothetical protein [Burkholderiales bacterium]MCZ8098991.1 hypothetical protein [Burkholderiales bacterium]MCZ8336867.1 hypothetical protein [Burkholderiaceae bacterium]